jgi:carbon storage regulator
MALLVLSRNSQRFHPGPKSQLRIGENILITILSIKGDQARIAIDAPRNLQIYREEVYQRLRAEIGPDAPIPLLRP